MSPLSVTASAERNLNTLTLDYQLSGDLGSLVLGPSDFSLKRSHGLWKSTCFEAFFAWGEDPAYWEWNVSPAGDWNLYHFIDYRKQQREELRVREPRIFVLRRDARCFQMQVELDLGELAVAQSFFLSLTCVLETQDGKNSYWAWKHSREEPDFHARESWRAL